MASFSGAFKTGVKAPVKICTVNVRGLRDKNKRRGVWAFLNSLDFDVCLLQEVHLRDDGDVKEFVKEWRRGESRWGVGGVHSTGVGVLFKGSHSSVRDCFSFVQGRVLVVDFDQGGNKFRLINVYAQAEGAGRRELFCGLDTVMCTDRLLILGGDFNVSLDRGGDNSGRHLETLIKNYSLVDVFRSCSPADPGFTWCNSRGNRSRLDYFFVDKEHGVVDAELLPVWFSDHVVLKITIEVSAPVFGRGCWRLNMGVLGEEGFRKAFVELYRGWVGLRPNCSSVVSWWEGVKEKVAVLARDFCRWKKGKEVGAFRSVRRRLQKLYGDWNRGGYFDSEEVDRCMAWQKRWCEARAEEYRVRARKEVFEGDEKCSAFFFKTVRAASAGTVVAGFRGEDGVLRTDAQGLLEVATEFYKRLFGEQAVEEEIGERFLGMLDARVPEAVRAVLELPISLEELTAALKGLKSGKVPGMDGIPKEFYEEFWDILGPDLLLVFQSVLEEGRLSPTMREGVVSLLFKKGDPEALENWRPITLLGADYKILARVLAGRLGLAMPHVVHEDQTCGVAGRSVFFNLQLVRDAISWVEDRGLPLVLVSLDQEKAFDRVSHSFLFRVLERLGFGGYFLKWLRLMYREVGSRVKVNGHVGDCVPQTRGVRQGCPLSPLLYVLYLEPLAAALRIDPRVEGLWVPGAEGVPLKVSMYADDITLFITSDRSVQEALRVASEFGRGSGASLNRNKSQIKYFGKWAERRKALGGIEACGGPIRVLGVDFLPGDSGAVNWSKRLDVVRRRLGLWQQRKLTISGKVLVLKADVLPTLVYLSYIFPMPARLRGGLTRAVFKFLWGSYEYVQRAQMYQAVLEGGRDVPCLPLKLDVLFFCNLCVALVRPVCHKFQFFVRFWWGGHMRRLCPWDNKAPRAETLPQQYKHALRWARRHEECRDSGLVQSHRSLYEALRIKMRPVRSLGVAREVWRRLQPKVLGNGLRDLNWLVVLNRLPVRDILYRHGISVNQYCPRGDCFGVETVTHVFWACSFAQQVWAGAKKRFALLQGLTERGVLFGEGKQGRTRKEQDVATLVVTIYKKALWDARCATTRNAVNARVRGVEGWVRAELEWRFKGEMEKWGYHAAWERWKGVWEGSQKSETGARR